MLISALAFAVLVGACDAVLPDALKAKATPRTVALNIKATTTRTLTRTLTATRTATPQFTTTQTTTPSDTPTAGDTPTPSPTPFSDPQPSATPGATFTPRPDALACAYHNTNVFHTLWDSYNDCHYDHEHGDYPFQAIAATFPDFDYFALLCGLEISHCNPSSPMENTHKHGGHKWQVDVDVPCEVFESADYCVTAAMIQYHWFGDASIEMESRVHSALAFVKACDPANVSDCGYLFADQHVDYGQRISQYQGDLMPYPDNPSPAYAVNFGPYLTIDRFGTCTGCRPSLAFVVSRNANANGVWTTKATGTNTNTPFGSTLLGLLIRNRDMYQLKDNADNVYPFTFGWLCSSNGGATYNPNACRYTNSTTRVHEIAGRVPAEWDNLEGFDTNPALGRITAQGYVTRFGTLGLECEAPGLDCHPVKLINMFVGKYGAALPGQKVSNPDEISNPSRNVWLCSGLPCAETDPGAVPSGWIGSEN